MGSENGLDVFDAIDKAWASLDLETVKSYISEDAVMKFADGKVAVGGDEFVEMIQQEVEQWGETVRGQQTSHQGSQGCRQVDESDDRFIVRYMECSQARAATH